VLSEKRNKIASRQEPSRPAVVGTKAKP